MEFYCEPITYNITYNLNGGTNASSNPSTYNVLYGVTFANPTRTGYNFAGWTNSAGQKITGINPGANANHSSGADLINKLSTRTIGNQTVTANWTAKSYTVTFNANGGSVSPGSVTRTHGQAVGTLPTPSRTGYTFDGWYTAASGGSKISSSTTVTGNVTYYAHWTIITYTISYNANGGSGAPGNQIKTHGQNLTLSSAKPTREGYTFQGWATSASGSVAYQPEGIYSGNASVTLFAVWKAAEYELSLYLNYSGKNYLIDSAFASGRLSKAYWASRNTDYATIEVDTNVKHNGYNSLKITNLQPGGYWTDGESRDLTFKTITQASHIYDAYLGDSKEMVLSFWAKSAEKGTKLYFRWTYEETYRSVTLSTEWKQYVIPMNKDPHFGRSLHPYADRVGTVWLSEIQLEDGNGVSAFAVETKKPVSSITGTYGGQYAKPADPVRTGYLFAGWYTCADGGEKVEFPLTVPAGHQHIYAHWIKDNVSITTQPKSSSAYVGDQTSFSVSASGTGLSYQWQVSSDGGKSWSNVKEGGTGQTFSLTVNKGINKRQYRCVVTAASGAKSISKAATLTVKTKITKQPVNVSGKVGETKTLTVTAKGSGLKYKWQYSKDGKSWKGWGSGASIQVPILKDRDGYRFRCVITDANGQKVTSTAVKLTVKKTTLAITTQPANKSVKAGNTATFTVKASGDGLNYKWQYSKDGKTWKSWGSGASIKVKAESGRNGYRFRCVVTDMYGKKVVSQAAKLTVK